VTQQHSEQRRGSGEKENKDEELRGFKKFEVEVNWQTIDEDIALQLRALIRGRTLTVPEEFPY